MVEGGRDEHRHAEPEEAGVFAERLARRQLAAGVCAGHAGTGGRGGDDGGEERRQERRVVYPLCRVLHPFTKPAIINHYYTSLRVSNKEVWALSRIAYHRFLLQFYSPALFSYLQSIQVEAELYVWDWFSQLFMGVFPLQQSCVILDMLISVGNDDFVLVCLSVAIVDEMREMIMRVLLSLLREP